jgi:methylated-DNA-protein-cysteine methyltransferase related protein
MSWDRVYRVVKQIPRGRVTTYGAVAKAIHEPGGARVVGYAMSATPAGRGIPWHRVLSAGGKIRMPEPHASKQRRLLASEGIEVGLHSIDMKIYGWEPKRPKSKKKKITKKNNKKTTSKNVRRTKK